MRLTANEWKVVRSEFETEPLASYGSLSAKYGVVKSAIHTKSKKEGWVKAGETASINEAAYRRADADDGLEREKNASSALKVIASREESEQKRAAVIVLHRQEWSELNNFRKAALSKMKEAIEAADRKIWWNAKIASDTILHHMRTLDIKQQGERRAWGLEQNQAQMQQPSPKPLLEIK